MLQTSLLLSAITTILLWSAKGLTIGGTQEASKSWIKENPDIEKQIVSILNLSKPAISEVLDLVIYSLTSILESREITPQEVIQTPELFESIIAELNKKLYDNSKILSLIQDAETIISPSDWYKLSQFFFDRGFYHQARLICKLHLPDTEKKINKQSKDYSLRLNLLGRVCLKLELYDEAESNFIESLKIERFIGQAKNNSSGLYTAYRNLAILYSEIGKYDEALKQLELSLRLKGIQSNTNKYLKLKSLILKSKIYLEQENYIDIKDSIFEILEIVEFFENNKKDYDIFYGAYGSLARYYLYNKNYKIARKFNIKAIKNRIKYCGKKHVDTSSELHNLGHNYRMEGKNTLAAIYLFSALRLKQTYLGNKHSRCISTLYELALVFKEQKKYNQAKSFLIQSIEIQEKSFNSDNISLSNKLRQLGILCRDLGDLDNAEKYLMRAFTIQKAMLGFDHIHTIKSICSLGILYQNKGFYRKARKHLKKAVKLSKKLLNSDDNLCKAICQKLSDFDSYLEQNNLWIERIYSFI